jgi:hypothetical protein
MAKTGPDGIRLEFAGGRPPVTDLTRINQTLHPVGFRAWPFSMSEVPDNIRQLLAQPTLDATQASLVEQHFLPSREWLLEIIKDAGRTPQVPGGGELSTLDTGNDVAYPQLFVIGPGTDYTRFDQFHVNATDAGNGLDEVMQILSGGGIRVLQHLPDGELFTVFIDTADGHGWIVTYDGGRPHIGSFSSARPGTKLLMQAIGPSRWHVTYVDA